MRDRLRNAYIWVSIPLLAWLIYTNLTLHHARDRALSHTVNELVVHLNTSEDAINHALAAYAEGDVTSGVQWLSLAERDWAVADTAARSYAVSLDNSYPLRDLRFYYLSLIVSIRNGTLHSGALSEHDRKLLEAVTADLRLTREGLSRELLLKRDGDAIERKLAELRDKYQLPPLIQ